MNNQSAPKCDLIRAYFKLSLLMAAVLLSVALTISLFPTLSGNNVLILPAWLLPVIVLMIFLLYRNFVRPSQQFLHSLQALNQGDTPPSQTRLPGIWQPNFDSLEKMFRDRDAATDDLRRQNKTLDRRNRELTAELDRFTATLGEEIHERAKAEKALQTANLKLQEQSLTDGMTGIANFHKFDEHLRQIWQQMARARSPVSLILCDIDFFRQFNHTYGHHAGDHCLQEIARAIEKTLCRTGDLVARYSGEEFAVLLPATDAQGARQVAEKIQQGIADLAIPHAGSLTGPCVGFSIGLASILPKRGSMPGTLLKAADQALFRAKHGGRNRIVS
jgi:diguanylate cyclase (GGDEF)-like protein